jgi:hypothetical protein
MTEYRASRYLKIIDETLAMVATVSSATTTALEIQGVVSRAVVRRRQLAHANASELDEGMRNLLRQACVREAGDTAHVLAIPIEAAYPFIGAVLIEKRPTEIKQRDRSMLQWLAAFTATIAPHIDVTTTLDDEILAVSRRHAREALA